MGKDPQYSSSLVSKWLLKVQVSFAEGRGGGGRWRARFGGILRLECISCCPCWKRGTKAHRQPELGWDPIYRVSIEKASQGEINSLINTKTSQTWLLALRCRQTECTGADPGACTAAEAPGRLGHQTLLQSRALLQP